MIKVKILYSIIILFSFSPVFAQEKVQHEQIAFDFYLVEIADPKLKGTLWISLENFSDGSFWFPKCLNNFKIEQVDSINSNISGMTRLALKASEKRLKIKPLHKGKYPRVYSTTSYSKTPNQIIVNIVEIHKYRGDIYHVEINEKGEVVNWCKGGWIE